MLVTAAVTAKASPGLQQPGKVKLIFRAGALRLSLDYIVSCCWSKALALAGSLDLARLTGQHICWLCTAPSTPSPQTVAQVQKNTNANLLSSSLSGESWKEKTTLTGAD